SSGRSSSRTSRKARPCRASSVTPSASTRRSRRRSRGWTRTRRGPGRRGGAEVAQIDPEEARALLEEFGVTQPGLESVIAACYRALDLITFLTTGEDETGAWEARAGPPAPDAAGVIHTDLQRGFIRADVIAYEDLVAAGSMEAAKAAGKVR